MPTKKAVSTADNPLFQTGGAELRTMAEAGNAAAAAELARRANNRAAKKAKAHKPSRKAQPPVLASAPAMKRPSRKAPAKRPAKASS